jgi:hypothetical protein
MAKSAHDYLNQLLPLFNNVPMGMVDIDAQGLIRLANPKAIQLLIPLAMNLNLSGDNLFDILMAYLPTVRQLITGFAPDSGIIVDQEPYRIRFSLGQSLFERYLSLTVNKVSPNDFLVFIEDVTDLLSKTDAIRQSL